MLLFNRISSAVFGVILAPFGDGFPWFDLVLWPVLAGILALVVYKYTSPQKAIAATKSRIKMHLLEIRLYAHDVRAVLGATGRILLQNTVYVVLNLVPMAVMIVPFVAVLTQIEARYAFDPLPLGAVPLVRLELDTEWAQVPATKVTLEMPPGLVLDAPPVHTPEGEIVWRIRAEAEGDHVLRIRVGDEVVEKGMAVGGLPRPVPVLRTKTWEALLYPGETGLPRSSAVRAVRLDYPVRAIPGLPDGELGIMLWFFGASLVSGYALKDVFGVVL
ncbi:MAG: hypothetical protein JXB39_00300 [Deltaproteobacteria bacterium]|nr:hypothetical protein [Deltaproteobacteria bacterium]